MYFCHDQESIGFAYQRLFFLNSFARSRLQEASGFSTLSAWSLEMSVPFCILYKTGFFPLHVHQESSESVALPEEQEKLVSLFAKGGRMEVRHAHRRRCLPGCWREKPIAYYTFTTSTMIILTLVSLLSDCLLEDFIISFLSLFTELEGYFSPILVVSCLCFLLITDEDDGLRAISLSRHLVLTIDWNARRPLLAHTLRTDCSAWPLLSFHLFSHRISIQLCRCLIDTVVEEEKQFFKPRQKKRRYISKANENENGSFGKVVNVASPQATKS